MKSTNDNKKKVIGTLLKKKIEGLKGIYGGVACTVPPKPIIITQCYICTVPILQIQMDLNRHNNL